MDKRSFSILVANVMEKSKSLLYFLNESFFYSFFKLIFLYSPQSSWILKIMNEADMNNAMMKDAAAEKAMFESQDPNRNIHMFYGAAADQMNVSRSKQR